MNRREPESDWKLKLRYGRLSTPFKHFTVLAEGRMNNANEFKCPIGPAWITMKTWAGDVEESGQMVQVIGEKIGFIITGKIEIYVTEPLKPPRKNPYGYDISFTPFEESIA